MNNYFVYKHTSPNNKVYIGITSQKKVNDVEVIMDMVIKQILI